MKLTPELIIFAMLAGPAALAAVGVVAFGSAIRSALCLVFNFFLLAFLLHRYGEQARHIIEKRLGLWVTLGAAVVVIGIVIAVYLI